MAEGISNQGQCLARISQLPAHHHHQAKAEEQKEQAADAVLDANHLVIGGENVPSPPSQLVVFVLVVVMGLRRCVRMGRGVHAKKIYRINYSKTKRVCKARNYCHPERSRPRRGALSVGG
jgi:hypothetical protein